jgi:hypothetical protein
MDEIESILPEPGTRRLPLIKWTHSNSTIFSREANSLQRVLRRTIGSELGTSTFNSQPFIYRLDNSSVTRAEIGSRASI